MVHVRLESWRLSSFVDGSSNDDGDCVSGGVGDGDEVCCCVPILLGAYKSGVWFESGRASTFGEIKCNGLGVVSTLLYFDSEIGDCFESCFTSSFASIMGLSGFGE